MDFGDFIKDEKTGITGWLMFSIKDFPITIRAYDGSIIPFIAADLILV
ncbi:hypothetical protein [Mesoplasma melaleucae]|nr:hypothetical protein [Mesoplasma melaleucae]